jgi:gliding motility-associated-like protein
MKKIIIIPILLCFIHIKSQVQLPYSGNGVCLDQKRTLTPNSLNNSKNLIVKDFNNDNYDDALVVDLNLNQVFIYTGNPTVTSGASIISTSGLSAYTSIEAGLFDNDNLLDIVLTYTNGFIKVFKNTSAIAGSSFSFNPSSISTFSINPVTPNWLNSPSYLKVADLNNDTFDDFVLAVPRISAGGGYDILAYRNLSVTPGTFTLDYSQSVFTGTIPAFSPTSAVVDINIGQFNNDNYKDIYLTYRDQPNKVTILTTSVTGGSILTCSVVNRSLNFGFGNLFYDNGESYDFNGDGYDEVIVQYAYLGGAVFTGIAVVDGAYLFVTPAITGIGGLAQNIQTPTVAIGGTLNPLGLPFDFKLVNLGGSSKPDLAFIFGSELIISTYTSTAPNVLGQFAPSFSISLPAGTQAQEMAIGRYDGNPFPDIFYKPWGAFQQGKTEVIPNFNFKISPITIDSNACVGKAALGSLTIVPISTLIPGTYTVDWYAVPSGTPPVSIFTGSTFTTSAAGDYVPELKFSFPAGPGNCAVKNDLSGKVFHVAAIPSPTPKATSSSSVICAGSNVTLTASSTLSNSPLPPIYVWSGVGSSTANAVITPTISGQELFSLTVKDSATKCVSSATVISVDVYQDTSQISTPKLLICVGDSALLTFPPTQSRSWSYYIYQGAPAPTFISSNTAIYVKPKKGTTYQIDYTDLNSCVSGKQIAINVDQACALVIYKGVTPNGDNLNDVWTIDNINRYPNNHVEIFNRWGISVYTADGYDNIKKFWPPKDSNVTPSTYYYVLDLGDGTAKIKGWMELITD